MSLAAGGGGLTRAGEGPTGRCAPGAGFSDCGILGFWCRVLGARRCRTAGFSRDSGAQRFRREIPRSREPQNPALAAEAAGPERRLGPGAVRPVSGLGFLDSRVLASDSRRAALPRGRILARPRRRRSRLRDSGARFPDPENPRTRHPAAPGGRADATVLFCCVCQEGSAPRSVSSPGLLGKPCLKTRKETRSKRESGEGFRLSLAAGCRNLTRDSRWIILRRSARIPPRSGLRPFPP